MEKRHARLNHLKPIRYSKDKKNHTSEFYSLNKFRDQHVRTGNQKRESTSNEPPNRVSTSDTKFFNKDIKTRADAKETAPIAISDQYGSFSNPNKR